MDPLSAVSLAGTVISFVDFSLKLASKATKMYSSENGSSEEDSNLETICATLSECSAKLSTATSRGGNQLPRSRSRIQDLAQACQTDCAAMLRILNKLKEARKFDPGDSTFERRAKALRGALKAVFKDPELKSIEARLQRTQSTLTLELCTISSTYHERHSRHLEELKRTSAEYQTHHTEQLEEIHSILYNLQRIHTATNASLADGKLHHDDVLGLEEHMSRLSIATHDMAYQQEIIKRLDFESFRFRQHGISEAHKGTYCWALHEGKRAECQERLEKWLAADIGSGAFWVSGKPGSGKSTFMKYVARSDQTMSKLGRWAQGHRVIIASHYFWSRGLPMQRSQQGLLQTLLLDIFRQYPHLISQVFNDDAGSSSQRTDAAKRIDWDVPRLRSTLMDLTSGKAPGVKFCIFIDGLDEFDGDHVDMGQYLLELSKSSLVKLCVSSRPLNVFEDAFGNNQSTKLHMHELNEADILKYTRSRLFEHPRWNLLLIQRADACSLVGEIAERSRGVFLWVFLVTGMLREGLTNDDNFTDLCKRLSSFPSDLHDFFQNIIGSVDPVYQERTAGFLRLARVAIEPLETLIYYFHDVQYDDQDRAPHQYSNFGGLDEDYKKSLQKYTLRRINAYCRGLLEYRNGKVGFLHRSVADFLDTPEMIRLLAENSRAELDPQLSILDCIASLLETQRHEHNLFSNNLQMSMTYAALVERRGDGSSGMAYILLDKIYGYLPLPRSVIPFTRSNFIKLAMKTHLIGYIHICLQRNPAYCDDLDSHVINVVLELPASSMKERLLDMVFKHEQRRDTADALRPSRVTKAWTTYIKTVTMGLTGNPGTPWRQMLEDQRIPRMFLEHGADPNAVITVKNDSRNQHSTAWVEMLRPAFRHRLEERSRQKCLAMMDTLIHHGAQFWERPMGAQIYSLIMNELHKRGLNRKDQKISPGMDQLFSSGREFTANVMARLLPGADWDISRFWPAIEMYLGAELFETMRARCVAATNGRAHPKSLVKASRSRSTSPSDMPARKRRRQLPGNDARQGGQKRLLTTPSVQNYYVISDSDDDGRKPAIKSTGTGTANDPLSIDDDSD
ncbi:DNA damage-inducible protein 1 [Apiospora marii]|uniref:DNA damage-inducible protein 1 n=1 Tax=Apiospora marii TaxID=335849 RepID=A0ABR1R0X3_9PEZI